MAFSAVGKKKVGSHMLLLLVDIVALAFAAKVNKFNDFFYVADLFPLALSIITLITLVFMLGVDFMLEKSWTGLPQTEMIVLGVLSVFWLSFNAFSTSRWAGIPTNCNSISAAFPDERAWCRDVQALKATSWLTFALTLLITLWTLKFCLTQYKKGQKHVFSVSLSRFTERHNNTTQYNSEPQYSNDYFGNGPHFQPFEKY